MKSLYLRIVDMAKMRREEEVEDGDDRCLEYILIN